MTRKAAILGVVLLTAVAVAAVAATRKICNAPAKQCEQMIRDMLSDSRILGAKVEESRWGVVVSYVAPGSPAADAGLANGDRIFAVNGRECKSPKEFKKLLHQAAMKQDGRVFLSVVRVGRLLRLPARMAVMSKEEIDKVVATHMKESHPRDSRRAE